MNNGLRWVLPVPLLLFVAAGWLYVETENEVRMLITRADRAWQAGDYSAAADIYESIVAHHPKSRYGARALWETGIIHQLNYNDANGALPYFTRLVKEYPGSPLVVDGYLKLAEIHEAEMMDLPRAIIFRTQALSIERGKERRREIIFRIADTHVKLNQFDQAVENFQLLLDGDRDDLADRSRVRIGTIMQIRREYEQAAAFFLQVLRTAQCLDCRREARLGLIESYEFMGELAKAIELATAIPPSEYPDEEKAKILRRLQEKERYYTP